MGRVADTTITTTVDITTGVEAGAATIGTMVAIVILGMALCNRAWILPATWAATMTLTPGTTTTMVTMARSRPTTPMGVQIIQTPLEITNTTGRTVRANTTTQTATTAIAKLQASARM